MQESMTRADDDATCTEQGQEVGERGEDSNLASGAPAQEAPRTGAKSDEVPTRPLCTGRSTGGPAPPEPQPPSQIRVLEEGRSSPSEPPRKDNRPPSTSSEKGTVEGPADTGKRARVQIRERKEAKDGSPHPTRSGSAADEAPAARDPYSEARGAQSPDRSYARAAEQPSRAVEPESRVRGPFTADGVNYTSMLEPITQDFTHSGADGEDSSSSEGCEPEHTTHPLANTSGLNEPPKTGTTPTESPTTGQSTGSPDPHLHGGSFP